MQLFNNQIVVSDNASDDLKRYVHYTNNSSSQTAINQIFEQGTNPTKTHFKVVKEVVNNELGGTHRAHDKDGNPLEWVKDLKDYNGTAEYVEFIAAIDIFDGIYYKEASITVFEGYLRKYYEEKGGRG